MFYKSFFSPAAAAALLLGVGLIAASSSASAETQVIGDVNLDGNATRAILIRSDGTPPQLKAGHLVNNQMQFTTLADPGANFRIVAATASTARAGATWRFWMNSSMITMPSNADMSPSVLPMTVKNIKFLSCCKLGG